jgi:hypothetical protein
MNIGLAQKELARHKPSSLLRKSVNYGRKLFHNIGSGSSVTKKKDFHDFSSRVPELSEEKFQKMKDFAGLLLKPCIHQGILSKGEGMLPSCPKHFSLAAFH